MKLYEVTYYTWNCTFSDLNRNKALSCGNDPAEAIKLLKQQVPKDAREFSAQEVKNVMGHKIIIED